MHTEKPWITTIIPTYNRPKTLKRAIESVLNQTYPNVLTCVYIDGSGEETVRVVEELAKADSRVKFFCHPKNIGSRPNFQYGLERVETPYFCFLSDDDYLFPWFYETAMEGFNAYPDIGFSSCPFIFVTEKNQIKWVTNPIKEDRVYYSVPDGLYNIGRNIFGWSGTVFRKSAADTIGKLDIEMNAIDIDYLVRMAARFPYVVTNKPAAFFVTHPTSDSFMLAENMFWPGWYIMIEKIKKEANLSDEVKREVEIIFRNFLEFALYSYAITNFREKKFERAINGLNIIKDNFPPRLKLYIYNVVNKISRSVPFMHPLFKGAYFLQNRLKCANKEIPYHKLYKEYLSLLPKVDMY